MSKNLFLSTLLTISSMLTLTISSNVQAQEIIFYDSFEDYNDWTYENVGNWTLRDLDLENQNGITGVTFPNNTAHKFAGKIVNSRTAVPSLNPVNIDGLRNYDAKTGDKVMGMFSSLLPPNNDWIISPKITLGENGNKLSFFVKSAYQNNNKYEKFRVLISTTDTETASFTAFPQVYEGNYFTNPDWTEFTIGLDDYSNKDVYFAINYISEVYDNPQAPPHLQKRAMTLLMDDFKVTKNVNLSSNEIQEKSINIYPNPVTDVINISNNKEIKNVSIHDLSGKQIMTKSLADKSGKINVSHLKPGNYILKTEIDGASKTFKFIKK